MVNTFLCFVLQSWNFIVRISIILIRHWKKSKTGSQLCLSAYRDTLYLLTVGELHVHGLRNELQTFCSLLSQVWHPCNDIQSSDWVTLSLAGRVSEMDEGCPGLREIPMTDSRRVLYELLRCWLIPILALFFTIISLIRKVLIFFIL